METERIKLKTLFAIVLSVAFVEIIGASIIHIWGAQSLVVLGCIRLLDVTVLIFFVNRYEGNTLHICLDPAGITIGVRKGVLWSLAFGLVAGSIAMILHGFEINPLQLIKTPLPKRIPEIVLYFLVGGIISPVAEEFFFRGLIYSYFRRWGFLQALILSTAFFVLLHPLSSGVPLPQIVGGLLFATAFEVEKNLLVPIIIHISGNLGIFTISWLTV